jgi:hypothetical protein
MKDTAGLGIWGEGNSLLSSVSSADVQPPCPHYFPNYGSLFFLIRIESEKVSFFYDDSGGVVVSANDSDDFVSLVTV